jgi:hypothetical protein
MEWKLSPHEQQEVVSGKSWLLLSTGQLPCQSISNRVQYRYYIEKSQKMVIVSVLATTRRDRGRCRISDVTNS